MCFYSLYNTSLVIGLEAPPEEVGDYSTSYYWHLIKFFCLVGSITRFKYNMKDIPFGTKLKNYQETLITYITVRRIDWKFATDFCVSNIQPKDKSDYLPNLSTDRQKKKKN